MTFDELRNNLLRFFKEVTLTERDQDDGSKIVVFSLRERLNGDINSDIAKAETFYHGFKFTAEELKELELNEMTGRIQFMYDRVMGDFKYKQTAAAINAIAENVSRENQSEHDQVKSSDS